MNKLEELISKEESIYVLRGIKSGIDARKDMPLEKKRYYHDLIIKRVDYLLKERYEK